MTGRELSSSPEPAANDENESVEPEPSSKDEEQEADAEKHDSRLALTLREAEIIARNLKESGARR